MKINELSKEDLNYIKSTYYNKDLTWDERMSELMGFFGKSERTVRKILVDIGLKEKTVEDSIQYKSAKEKKINKKKKRFLVTWAQNNTSVFQPLLTNMEAYAKFLDAEILVICGRYSNFNQKPGVNTEESWDPKLEKYLCANEIHIHKYLTVMGDVKISATSTSPLNGMHGMSKENSCIFGSPKSQLEMVPTLNGYKPKMMLTTGSITQKNYSDSRIGKLSSFNHQYSFCSCECDNNEIFHARQVVANEEDGSFNDLYFNVKDSKVTKNKEIEAIIFGDLHYGNHDEKVLTNTFSLLDKLKPNHVVLHDVMDTYSVSHHNQDNPYKQYALEVSGNNSLENELRNLFEGLKRFEKFKNVLIVRSNHDVHLDKFLQNDWRKLPTGKNSLLYMELAQMLLKQYASDNVIGIIPELINKKFPKFKTLKYSDSYVIKNWEVAAHGDVGSGGARPSAATFLKLNKKIITAHTHSPKKKDGLMTVGTSTKLKLDYNSNGGSSSWLNSHALVFNDGKSQLIHFIGKNKEFTNLKY